MPQRAARVVRDPVHNYVALSNLETHIVDSPLFQRLRYITQNGLAHLTYPSNRTSRFTHSLGCMHIGGEFLLVALRNAARDVRIRFLVAAFKVIDQLGFSFRTVEEFLRETDDPFYRLCGLDISGDQGSEEAGRSITEIIVLQAVRIACVIHDVGHWPFSHTMEIVLEAQSEGPNPTERSLRHAFVQSLRVLRPREESDIALHEAAGHRLMEHIFRESLDEEKGLKFAELCLRTARGIIRGSLPGVEDPFLILGAVHDLVSSDFDADRADYVQRDGLASGFEFGSYDLDRIVRSMQIFEYRGRFMFRPSVQAVSAIESFFLERLRIYRWLVYHHSVVRSDLVLQRALHLLLRIYFDGWTLNSADTDAIRDLLRKGRFDRLWTSYGPKGNLDDFCSCDESWLLGLFRDLLDSAVMKNSKAELSLLALYLRAVCEREKTLIRPLWKRLEEYREFATSFLQEATKNFNDFFSDPANSELGALSQKGDPVAFVNSVFKKSFPTSSDRGVPPVGGEVAMFERFEDELGKRWSTTVLGGRTPGPLLFSFAYRLKPGPESFDVFDTATGGVIDVCKLSTLVSSLSDVWLHDVQAFLFLVRKPEDPIFDPREYRASLGLVAAQVLLDPAWLPNLSLSAGVAKEA
jgi:HD superfamily phosphohydrolase